RCGRRRGGAHQRPARRTERQVTGPDETDGPDFAREAGNAEPEPQHGTGAPLGSGPSPVDLAEMALVEAELDRRWPETKIEPSLARIAALMDILGSPQRNYPVIHVAGTNGKTSVTRMSDALLTRMHPPVGRAPSPHLH